MYSKKLQDFIDAHRPEAVVWDEKTIRDLAAKAGLEIRPAGEYDDVSSSANYGWIMIKWGKPTGQVVRRQIKNGWFRREYLLQEDYRWEDTDLPARAHSTHPFDAKGLVVEWHEKVAERSVTYAPFVYWGEVPEALVQVAGLEPMEVALPESVVELPTPGWLTPRAAYCDGEVPGNETITCFHSEAAAIVAPFVRQLVELMGQKVPEDMDALLGWLKAWGFSAADNATWPPGIANGLLRNWLQAAVARGAIIVMTPLEKIE